MKVVNQFAILSSVDGTLMNITLALPWILSGKIRWSSSCAHIYVKTLSLHALKPNFTSELVVWLVAGSQTPTPHFPSQVIASIKAHCLVKLAAFKVPGQVFITDVSVFCAAVLVQVIT